MNVRNSLQGHLVMWLQAQSPAIPCAWENVPFTPPQDVKDTYLRAFIMPASRSGESFCGFREDGVFQVSIYTGRDRSPTPGQTIAESICEHFKPGSYAGFSVLRPPYHSQGINTDDGRYLIPVSVFYKAT